MNPSIIFTGSARNDIREISQKYEAISPELGILFGVEVREILSRIVDFPMIYGVITKQIRAGEVNTFPYVVYYYLKKSDIVVLGIYHNRQSTKNLASRLRFFEKDNPD